MIERVERVTPELVEAFRRLVPQLSASSPPPGPDQLAAVVESPATTLLVARGDSGRVLGSLTLACYPMPTGVRAWIEDVVVDVEARGQGIGEALTREAVRLAGEHGARAVDLTSRPDREAANRLYRRLGFRVRETNAFRLEVAR